MDEIAIVKKRNRQTILRPQKSIPSAEKHQRRAVFYGR